MSASISRSHSESAVFMNRVRLLVATFFLLLYAYGTLVLRDPSFKVISLHLAVYWILSTVLWALGKRSRLVLNLSRFSVPLIDIPMATWVQWTRIGSMPDGETSAVFTLGLYVFLIVLSSFSMRPRHLFLSGATALLGLFLVYSKVALTALAWVSGPMLLILTAIIMSWLPRRQRALVLEVAERQARRDRLARYFSPGVAEVIESHEHPQIGETCEITVLFCDIRGFTRLSEKLDAPAVVSLLNDFLGHMVEEVFRFGGTLDKYLGDGLLTYFNAPVRQVDHAVRAVSCALAMIDRLEVLNRSRLARDETPLAIGIGIHSGAAVVGNIGAEHRREFTAIGDTVNVASRLQSLTRDRGVPILVSESVAERIGTGSTPLFRLEAGEPAEVRGLERKIGIYHPVRD